MFIFSMSYELGAGSPAFSQLSRHQLGQPPHTIHTSCESALEAGIPETGYVLMMETALEWMYDDSHVVENLEEHIYMT